MTIHMIGASYRSAPVELREQLAFPSETLAEALSRFRTDGQSCLSELIILSTCNRLELYGVTEDPETPAAEAYEALSKVVAETRDLAVTAFHPHLYRLSGSEAVGHLCRVASGLDSMVLGESEILGQVSRAHDKAAAHRTTGPLLKAAVRTAVRAGRRARAETEIGQNAASLSSIAVRLAEVMLPDEASPCILLVGAGKMGGRAADTISGRGGRLVGVVSRTPEHATALAQRCRTKGFTYPDLPVLLPEADIVIAATYAPGVVIDEPMVQEVMKQRKGRPLAFIDIAVPRDVEPAVRRLAGVVLLDLDDLQARLDNSMLERKKEIPLVEGIIEEEVSDFEQWFHARAVAPLLQDLRAKLESIRRKEVDKAMKHLGHLDGPERQQIERLSESLLRKFLHVPTVHLRAEAGNGRAAELTEMMRELFGLESEAPSDTKAGRQPETHAE